LKQLSLTHKNHFFNVYDDNFTLRHEGDEGCDYISLDPTKTQPTKFDSYGNPNYTIRVFSAPKRVPLFNSDVLKIIFDCLYDDDTSYYSRKMDFFSLCLSCRHWSSIARPYLKTQRVLGVVGIYPDLILQVDFQNKVFNYDGEKRFSKKAWVNYGREFLNILSRIPGTSHLYRINFDNCFNTFHPSEWSRCLHRCSRLRFFFFRGRECHWEDIKLFLITFQTRSRVNLGDLRLDDISDQGINCESMDASLQNQGLEVGSLEIYRLGSNSLLSNVLSFISPNLESVKFGKTSLDNKSAMTLLGFLSSLDPKKLKQVDCSLMPPSLNKYDPFLGPDDSLIWSDFSSSLLKAFEFDGGVFGFSAITSHHISMLSKMPNLGRLVLKYCFDVRNRWKTMIEIVQAVMIIAEVIQSCMQRKSKHLVSTSSHMRLI
jgi:hypothetical protein